MWKNEEAHKVTKATSSLLFIQSEGGELFEFICQIYVSVYVGKNLSSRGLRGKEVRSD